ncbi:MAG: hypothetical protein AAGC68_12775, partial [Verrucomicrobiota bacterium]
MPDSWIDRDEFDELVGAVSKRKRRGSKNPRRSVKNESVDEESVSETSGEEPQELETDHEGSVATVDSEREGSVEGEGPSKGSYEKFSAKELGEEEIPEPDSVPEQELDSEPEPEPEPEPE